MWRFSRWACLCLSLSGFQFLCFLSNSCSLFGVCMLVDVFGFVYVFVPKVNWIDCILGVYDGLCGFGLDKCGAIRGVTILQIPQLDWIFDLNFFPQHWWLIHSCISASGFVKINRLLVLYPDDCHLNVQMRDRNSVCFTEFCFSDLYRIDPRSNQIKNGSLLWTATARL